MSVCYMLWLHNSETPQPVNKYYIFYEVTYSFVKWRCINVDITSVTSQDYTMWYRHIDQRKLHYYYHIIKAFTNPYFREYAVWRRSVCSVHFNKNLTITPTKVDNLFDYHMTSLYEVYPSDSYKDLYDS